MDDEATVYDDVMIENGGNVWIRKYPHNLEATCPVCQAAFHREKSLTAHVKTHFKTTSSSLIEKWACSSCDRQYSTRQGAANHFSQVHAVASSVNNVHENEPTNRVRSPTSQEYRCRYCGSHFSVISDLNLHKRVFHQEELITLTRGVGDDGGSAKQPSGSQPEPDSLLVTQDGQLHSQIHGCTFCPSHFKTNRGLRNHERAIHQDQVSASLAVQDQARPASQGARPPRSHWSIEEIERFRLAAEKHGLHSNKILAEAIGTRNKNQVAHFKQRYIRDNDKWALKHLNAPSLEGQSDMATQSSPSISQSSRRSVSSQALSPSAVGSPSSTTTAREAVSPLSLAISTPQATRAGNPLLEEADRQLARLRGKDQLTTDPEGESNASPQPARTDLEGDCRTMEDLVTPLEQSSPTPTPHHVVEPMGLLAEGEPVTQSSEERRESSTSPPMEESRPCGELESLSLSPLSPGGVTATEPAPRDPPMEETTVRPQVRQEEQESQPEERSRHRVDPEESDYQRGSSAAVMGEGQGEKGRGQGRGRDRQRGGKRGRGGRGGNPTPTVDPPPPGMGQPTSRPGTPRFMADPAPGTRPERPCTGRVDRGANSGNRGWSAGQYNWYGPDWRGESGRPPYWTMPDVLRYRGGVDQQGSEVRGQAQGGRGGGSPRGGGRGGGWDPQLEVSGAWGDWGEGPGREQRASGGVPQRKDIPVRVEGLGRGRGLVEGGGVNKGFQERGRGGSQGRGRGEPRKVPITSRNSLEAVQMNRNQAIHRGITEIRGEVERVHQTQSLPGPQILSKKGIDVACQWEAQPVEEPEVPLRVTDPSQGRSDAERGRTTYPYSPVTPGTPGPGSPESPIRGGAMGSFSNTPQRGGVRHARRDGPQTGAEGNSRRPTNTSVLEHEQVRTPVGDTGWMVSQRSGKGKSPVGRKGTNKGTGAGRGKGQRAQRSPGENVGGAGLGPPGGRSRGSDRGPSGGGPLVEEGTRGRGGRNHQQGNRAGNLPTQPGGGGGGGGRG